MATLIALLEPHRDTLGPKVADALAGVHEAVEGLWVPSAHAGAAVQGQ